MPIAANPDTGETFYLDKSGQWQPAKTAINPNTKQLFALDAQENKWSPVNVHGQGIMSYVDDAVRALASGVTFGYADRFAAEMQHLTGGGSYEHNLQIQQARTASEPAAIRVPGEIAGAVAGTVAGAPIAGGAAKAIGAAVPLAERAAAAVPGAVKAITGGAAAGGLYGSSEGEGIKQRAKNAGIGALTGGLTAGTFTGLGKMIGSAGDKIMTSVIKPSIRDVKDGFDISTVKEFNLGGNLRQTLAKTQTAINDLSGQLKQKLSESSKVGLGTIDLNGVYDRTERALLNENKLRGFGANTRVKSSLDALKAEINHVSPNGVTDIPDAQIIKQSAGNFGAWQYGRPDPESKASEIVYNTFYHELKKSIENASPPGVKEINQKLSKLIPVQNAVIRRLPVSDRNSIISFPEMIGIIGSVAHPGMLGTSLLYHMSRAGSVGNAMSKLGGAMALSPTSAAAAGTAGAATYSLGRSSLTGSQ